jgi:YgiT-type zinc finger domain-containing protein
MEQGPEGDEISARPWRFPDFSTGPLVSGVHAHICHPGKVGIRKERMITPNVTVARPRDTPNNPRLFLGCLLIDICILPWPKEPRPQGTKIQLQVLLFRSEQTIPPIVLKSFSFMLYFNDSPYESGRSPERGDILSVIDKIRYMPYNVFWEVTIMYNYGKCEICDTALEEKSIQQDFWIKDKLVVIEKVPAGVCPQCGEKVVKAEVGEHIAELLKDSNRINKAPTISVPFIRYEAETAPA